MEEKMTENNNLSQQSPALLQDLKKIIEQGRREAYAAASISVLKTYWNIGKRIVEEEQHGERRAIYGTKLLRHLAEQLTKEFGKGFSYRSLNEYRRFYLSFKDLEIVHTRVPNLTWSHFKSCEIEQQKRYFLDAQKIKKQYA